MRPDQSVNRAAITRHAVEAAATAGGPIPCHRCGVCCTRWQPLLTAADIAGLAGYLGITPAGFLETYTRPYPFDDETPLLRQEQGACVFLAWEQDGHATCTVHTARPAVCREWSAGLDKRECLDGLARVTRADGSLDLPLLYPDAEERAAYLQAVGAGQAREET